MLILLIATLYLAHAIVITLSTIFAEMLPNMIRIALHFSEILPYWGLFILYLIEYLALRH